MGSGWRVETGVDQLLTLSGSGWRVGTGVDQLITLSGQRLEGRDRGGSAPHPQWAAAGGGRGGGTGVGQLLTLSGQLLLLMAKRGGAQTHPLPDRTVIYRVNTCD